VFLVFLVFAVTGPTFAYDGYRDELTALLTWTKLPLEKPVSPGTQKRQADDSGQPRGDSQPTDTRQLTAESSRPAPLDTVWTAFQAAVHTDVTTVLFPVSQKPTPTVTVRYLTRDSPHYRAYNEITLERDSGKVLSHALYARQSLGKQISIGMLAVHRGKVFGVAGEMVFMLAALALPLQCTTGYLLYIDRRRRKARARAARHDYAAGARPPPTTAPTANRSSPG
jgi:sulfite reductase (NADPH) flavoprotein alpha-component